MQIKKNLFWAIPFIYVGLVWQAKNMGYLTSGMFGTLVSWQALLMYIGVWGIATGNSIKGLASVAIGAVFLLPELGILTGDWAHISWPLAFIIIGMLVLLKPLLHRGHKPHQPVRSAPDACTGYACSDGYVELNNRFGAVRQIVFDPVFKGAVIKNSFGGIALDLRRTTLADPVTYIDVECTFGGIEIYAPAAWNIQPRLHAAVGGCDDKRQTPPAETDLAHTVIIRGTITFGGIEFKS